MDEKQLQALANELAKNLKIPEDFSQFLKVRQDSRVINKSVFLASGINIEGQKELPGMWLTKNEGAKFWLNVLTELNVPDRLLGEKSGVAGNPVCVPEMDDAVEGLASGNEPLYYRVR